MWRRVAWPLQVAIRRTKDAKWTFGSRLVKKCAPMVSNICKMPGVPTLSTQWPAIGGVGYYRSFSAIKGARTENHEEVSPYALLCRNDRQGLNTLGPPKRKNPKECSEIFEDFSPLESNSSQRAGS